MKPNFTVAFFYFIYLGLATFLHPAKGDSIYADQAQTRSTQQEISIAKETPEILHSELLFRF